MSENFDVAPCIWGRYVDMDYADFPGYNHFHAHPFYQLSAYSFLIPFVFGLLTLGKAISGNRYPLIIIAISLIILSSACSLIFASGFSCLPNRERHGSKGYTYAFVDWAASLSHYMSFVLLYIWMETLL